VRRNQTKEVIKRLTRLEQEAALKVRRKANDDLKKQGEEGTISIHKGSGLHRFQSHRKKKFERELKRGIGMGGSEIGETGRSNSGGSDGRIKDTGFSLSTVNENGNGRANRDRVIAVSVHFLKKDAPGAEEAYRRSPTQKKNYLKKTNSEKRKGTTTNLRENRILIERTQPNEQLRPRR